jgi:hypothetical protein
MNANQDNAAKNQPAISPNVLAALTKADARRAKYNDPALRAKYAEPEFKARFLEALRNNQPYGYIVSLANGEQFLCPTRLSAEETSEARGGVKVDAIYDNSIPAALHGCYQWRPSAGSPWKAWKYIDNGIRHLADELTFIAERVEDPNDVRCVQRDIVKVLVEIDPSPEELIAGESWAQLFHSRADFDSVAPPRFLIDGFLPEEGVTAIAGPSGSLKTFTALSIVRSLLEGNPLFDYFEVNHQAERVVYLVPEVGLSSFKKRLEKMHLMDYVGKKLFVQTLSHDSRVLLTDSRLLEAVKGADVFLDTMIRFTQGDENSSGDQRQFADELFALLRAGARSVIGIHHSPKAFGSANHMTLENVLRGSGDIGAMLSVCWGVSKIDDEKSRIFVQCVKNRDFDEPTPPFVVEGRPRIDLEGKFRLVHAPGTSPDYMDFAQGRRGRQGGRPSALSPEDVREALELQNGGMKLAAIAEELGVSTKTLRNHGLTGRKNGKKT